MANIVQKCPACSGEMEIRLVKCEKCGTEIQGNFTLSRFDRLTGEQLLFLETFVKLRGSLKDLCNELKISYPTARNRLDLLIEALEFHDKAFETSRRLKILEKLKNDELTTQEALNLLQSGSVVDENE